MKCLFNKDSLMLEKRLPIQILGKHVATLLTEFRQPLQVQSHLEMPGILVQLGHTQRT